MAQALLNWQWSNTVGPQTNEQVAIFWVIVFNDVWAGIRYLQVKEFAPLLCLWLAPLCSVAAYFMA
jgi:hypothetical protein